MVLMVNGMKSWRREEPDISNIDCQIHPNGFPGSKLGDQPRIARVSVPLRPESELEPEPETKTQTENSKTHLRAQYIPKRICMYIWEEFLPFPRLLIYSDTSKCNGSPYIAHCTRYDFEIQKFPPSS